MSTTPSAERPSLESQPAERIVLPPPEVIDHMIAELEAMPIQQLMGVFTQGVELYDHRLFELDSSQLDMAFLDSAGVGPHPIRVLLGLLADREVRFAAGLRRTIAIDGAMLDPWDPDALIDAGLYRGPTADGEPSDAGPHGTELLAPPPVGGFIGTVHTMRHWTLDWLGVLPDAAWARVALDPHLGQLSVRQQVAKHLAEFQRDAVAVCAKVEHFLGPAPSACCGGTGAPGKPQAAGGCGPGCGCR